MPMLAEQRARAGARARARRRTEAVSFAQQEPPTVAPGLGVAYASIPTMAPLLESLNPWKDAQPVDTAIGAFLATGLAQSPTVTPLPLQSSLNIVRAGCPVLLNWPKQLDILALDPCGTTSEGSWLEGSTQKPVVIYDLSCSPFHSGAAPRTSYSQVQEGERGELFAASQMRTTLVGSKVDLMDCAGNVRYTVEEKVFHQKGSADVNSCEKYKSCDGTVWIQYFLHEPNGTIVAETGYLNIFQANFNIIDPATGGIMASAERVGEWNPAASECLGPRRWRLSFAEQMPPGPLALPTEQWPLASMITVLSLRDASRRSSGLLNPTFCEAWKITLQVIWILLAITGLTFALLLCLKDVIPPLTATLYELEQRICPRRMYVPSKFDGS